MYLLDFKLFVKVVYDGAMKLISFVFNPEYNHIN